MTEDSRWYYASATILLFMFISTVLTAWTSTEIHYPKYPGAELLMINKIGN